jgi:hypothetical protein
MHGTYSVPWIVTNLAYEGRSIEIASDTSPFVKYLLDSSEIRPMDPKTIAILPCDEFFLSVHYEEGEKVCSIEQAVKKNKNLGYWNNEGRFFSTKEVSPLSDQHFIRTLYNDLRNAKPGDKMIFLNKESSIISKVFFEKQHIQKTLDFGLIPEFVECQPFSFLRRGSKITKEKILSLWLT